MNFFILVALALQLQWLQLAWALPGSDVLQAGRRSLVKRALPTFLNFPDTPEGSKNKARAVQAFYDMVLMVAVVRAKLDTDPLLDTYFRASEDREAVIKVFDLVLGENKGGEGSDALQYLVIAGDDFGKKCGPTVIAYLVNVENSLPYRAGTHFCDKGYGERLVDEVDCDDLGDVVSAKMSTLGGVLFHELMHFDAIGKLAIGTRIEDLPDKAGYGPQNVRKVRQDSKQVPLSNADNYRWYLLEAYFTALCKKTFKPPTDNKNDYKACEDASPDSTCEIQ